MAKAKTTAVASNKISFGKKRRGVAKKGFGKYDEKPKKYKGQGR